MRGKMHIVSFRVDKKRRTGSARLRSASKIFSAIVFLASLQRLRYGRGTARRQSRWPRGLFRLGFYRSLLADTVCPRRCLFSFFSGALRSDQSALPFAYKGQFVVDAVPIDAHEVAHPDLLG